MLAAQMTIINKIMESLQDKDVFLVKIPNKLRDLLKQPEVFSLTAESEEIGTLEELRTEGAFNAESSELGLLLGKRKGFSARFKLDVPVKRQKVIETQRLEFNLTFPAFEEKPISKTT